MIAYNTQTPVLLIILLDLKRFKRIISVLRKVKPRLLYIAMWPEDPNRKKTTGFVTKDHVMSGIDWECTVSVLDMEKKRSSSRIVYQAVDWFFKNESEGIILDGLDEPTEEFLIFCSTLLDKYRDNEDVGHISAGYYFNKGSDNGK